jgi:hypothetical protein
MIFQLDVGIIKTVFVELERQGEVTLQHARKTPWRRNKNTP